MLDLIYVLATLSFFWISWRYVKACEKL